MAGNPVRCVCVCAWVCTHGQRASAGKFDEKKKKTNVMYVQVRSISCCNAAEKCKVVGGKGGNNTDCTVLE